MRRPCARREWPCPAPPYPAAALRPLGQDTQAYKPPGLVAKEQASDPLPRLYAFLRAGRLTEKEIADVEHARAEAEAGLAEALALPEPDRRR